MAFNDEVQGFKRKFSIAFLAIVIFALAIFSAVLLTELTSQPWFLTLAITPLVWVQFSPSWRKKATETRPYPTPNWPLAAALWTALFALAHYAMGIVLEGALLALCALLILIVVMMFFIQAWSRHMSDKHEKFNFDWLE